jgi:DNA mismatch repair ATPase MutL
MSEGERKKRPRPSTDALASTAATEGRKSARSNKGVRISKDIQGMVEEELKEAMPKAGSKQASSSTSTSTSTNTSKKARKKQSQMKSAKQAAAAVATTTTKQPAKKPAAKKAAGGSTTGATQQDAEKKKKKKKKKKQPSASSPPPPPPPPPPRVDPNAPQTAMFGPGGRPKLGPGGRPVGPSDETEEQKLARVTVEKLRQVQAMVREHPSASHLGLLDWDPAMESFTVEYKPTSNTFHGRYVILGPGGRPQFHSIDNAALWVFKKKARELAKLAERRERFVRIECPGKEDGSFFFCFRSFVSRVLHPNADVFTLF